MSDLESKIISFRDRTKGHLPPPPSGPYDGGDGEGSNMEKRIQELEKTYLQVAVDIASIKTRIYDMPTKDWVHLRLWAIAAFIVASVGLMIRFIPQV